MRKKRTQQNFIHDSKEVHGDKYDYSEVKYVNQLTKVKFSFSFFSIEKRNEENSKMERVMSIYLT